MNNLLKILFPFELQLHILQLEEYKLLRFTEWNIRNLFVRKVFIKKTLVYTQKIKYLITIYFVILVILLTVNIYLFILFLLEPFLGLLVAVIVLKPYEIYNRRKTIKETRNKILSLKNLKVIGITGSFGKTSTKEILYQILKTKYKVLRTPESFNTIFGISKVVDLELDKNYDYFICEMAAYKRGEIKEICQMVPPEYGILTGITTQHFERFGSLDNTIKAKFELVDAIPDKTNIVFNIEDKNIIKQTQKLNIKIQDQNIEARGVKFSSEGSIFTLVIDRKKYRFQTALFGFANVKNIVLAASMALKLALSEKEIINAIKNLKPFDNRNVLTKVGKLIIVNNTYSSNIQSFRETIETAKKIKGKKVLVTPGIVELGKLEAKSHEELGRLSREIFDKVVLVGKNNRTKSFAKGLARNFEFINDSREEYFKKLEWLKKEFNWIFLENDVTENY